ncbi:MAG: ATP-binding cassette domain-containing protein [Rhodospirillales bacterium]
MDRDIQPTGQPAGPDPHLVLDLRDVSPMALTLAVPARSLLMIQVTDWRQAATLIDLATGRAKPRSGTVRFLGRDWATLPPIQAEAMRGRIGYVLRDGNWLDSLTVFDNILLPRRYHTRRPLAELEDDAVDLATRLGLPGVPLGFPAEVGVEDLQRAACIRAFLGRPALVILEEPTRSLAADVFLEPLVNVIRLARDREAAVFWFTQNPAIWGDPSLPATGRYRLRDVLHRMVMPASGGRA